MSVSRIAGLLFLSAGAGFGAPVSVTMIADVFNFGSSTHVCLDSHSSAGSGTANVQCGFSITNAVASTTTFSATAQSAGSPGSVDSLTQLIVGNVRALSTGQGIDVYGGVDVTDHITNLSTSSITLKITVVLTGTTTASNDPQYSPSFTAGTGATLSTLFNGNAHCNPTAGGNSGTCVVTATLGPGETASFDLGLATRIDYTKNFALGGPAVTGGVSTFLMDYYGASLDVTGFSATTLGGAPVSLSLISSGSGIALTSSGYANPAPEPATILMFGAALAGLTLQRARAARRGEFRS